MADRTQAQTARISERQLLLGQQRICNDRGGKGVPVSA